ncbi:MAG: hypothetical protein J7621_21785 [Niastella sp.]|nr:hypothetical protein [Niastella sp.]
MKTRISIALILFVATALLGVGCKKNKDATPTGTLLNYTNLKSTTFDRIDIIVDGKVAGTITMPYTTKPVCGDASSPIAAAIKLSVGNHKVYALQYKDGKEVAEWPETTEVIKEDKCTLANWVE